MTAAACSMPADVVHPATLRAPLSAFRCIPDNDMGAGQMGTIKEPTAEDQVALEVVDNTLSIRASAAAMADPARPVSSFKGVAVAVRRGGRELTFNLSLVHENPRLSIPLSCSTEAATVAREWEAWGKALGLPLLAMGDDGTVEAELKPLGVVLAERPSPRRRGSALVGRRSPYARRRRAAAPRLGID